MSRSAALTRPKSSPRWPSRNTPWSALVVGFGLMGASMALAMRARWPRLRLVAVDRAAVTRQLLANGLVEAAGPLSRVSHLIRIHRPKVVILALPLGRSIEVLPVLAKAVSALPDADRPLIIDLGSVKGSVLEAACASRCPRFIGGHPMTGAEHQGFAHADPTLFRGRPFVLCKDAGPSRHDQRLAVELVRAIGSDPVWLDARTHDEVVALISHLPHLCAFTLLEAARHPGGTGGTQRRQRLTEQLAAGSWRDATRVGAADPRQWTSIFFHNRTALVRALDTWLGVLQTAREHLQSAEDASGFELGFDPEPLARARRRWGVAKFRERS